MKGRSKRYLTLPRWVVKRQNEWSEPFCKGKESALTFPKSLPTDPFLVGNECDIHPIFAEKMAHMSKREQQWERIRPAGANRQLCDLFEDRHAYR